VYRCIEWVQLSGCTINVTPSYGPVQRKQITALTHCTWNILPLSPPSRPTRNRARGEEKGKVHNITTYSTLFHSLYTFPSLFDLSLLSFNDNRQQSVVSLSGSSTLADGCFSNLSKYTLPHFQLPLRHGPCFTQTSTLFASSHWPLLRPNTTH
jgi:hypothetical protein